MERRSGLGRGLSALLPTEAVSVGDAAAGIAASLQELPIESIEPNPFQPRVHFDEEALVELAASIREIGLLQPVLVRPTGTGRYQLIAGERRWRAAKRAGLDLIPAVVRQTDDLAAVEQALVENLHREDLTALEEAAAYQQLVEDFNMTHEEVAKRVSKSRAAITNTLRLLQLAPAVQHLLADGRLSAGHARALLAITDRGRQELAARQVVDEGLTVRAVEELVRQANSPTVPQPTRSSGIADRPLRAPGLLELEELLGEYLQTRVTVGMSNKRGRIAIEFADLEDLERIYRIMTEGSRRG